MAVVNKIIHRFVHPRSDYEENGSLFNQIIPYNVQAYSYELKPNGDPNIPDDYIVRYVLGTGRSTYIEIANGRGRSLEGNFIPELSKEFILNSSSQLTDIITKLIESQVIVSSYITSNVEGDPFPTKASLDNAETWYEAGQSVLPKKNDYVIVTADETHPSGTGDPQTVKYVCAGIDENTNKPIWEYQYIINNGNFTPEQQAAINSGITAEKVQQYDNYADEIASLLDHLTDYNNPHRVTAEQIGLGNVDNTSDLDKPISTATQEALETISETIADHIENEDVHVTPEEKLAWTNKQDTLKTGNHIKISNNTISVLDDLSTYDNTVSQFVNKSTNELENYYTKEELDGIYRFLGEVPTRADLPSGNMYAPDTYTELTYLLADQLEYIDTHYHPNQNTQIKLKFSINGEGNNYLYGTDLVTEENKVAFGINYGTTTANALFGPENISFDIDNQVHTLLQRRNGVYLDDTLVDMYPDILDFTTASTLWLFRAQTPDTHPENISIYEVEIYENDELIKHYIPVRRKADNALGMYEIGSDEFYQNEYNPLEFNFTPGDPSYSGNHNGDVYKVLENNTLYIWHDDRWIDISQEGGGGKTYEAGIGINIDQYNVISNTADIIINGQSIFDENKVATLGTMAQENKDDYVLSNSEITGATHTKITYDNKGLVVSGEDLVEFDIPSLHFSKIVDANNVLSPVAFSGAYTDLTGTPTFKTINSETITGSGNILLQTQLSGTADYVATYTATAGVLSELGFDTTPTQNSTNLIKSGTVWSGLQDKVNVTDIVNDLVSADTDKPLSAYQGKILDEKITLAQQSTRDRGVVSNALTSQGQNYTITAVEVETTGINYTQGDILFLVSDMGIDAMFTVVTVDDITGGITSVSVSQGGAFSVAPSTTGVAFTGGTGIDATFNLTIDLVDNSTLASIPNPQPNDFATVLEDEIHNDSRYVWKYADINGDGTYEWVAGYPITNIERNFYTNPIQNGELGTNAVTTAKIANNNVTAEKIAYNAILGRHISTGAIVDSNVAPGAAIQQSKIANLTTDLAAKVDKTNTPSKVYGTDDSGNQTLYDLDSFGAVSDVLLNGTSVVNNTVAELNLEAGDSSYHNDAVVSITNVQQALDNLMNIHYYVNPSYSTFTVDRSGNYDVGTVLTQPFTVTWVLNKQPESGDTETLKLDGTTLLNIMSLQDQSKWKSGTYTYTSNLTSNSVKTYTFRVDYKDNHSTVPSGKTNTCNATKTFNFMYRRYWGVTSTTTLTDEQLYALSNELSTSRVQERDFNCTGGKYWWFVIPTTYCSGIAFTDVGSGLPMTLPPECISTRTITNSQGVSYSVNVYRGEFIQTASSVKIKVS